MSKKAGNTAVSGFLWEGDIVHLVFQHPAAEALQKSFELDDRAKGDVLVISEDYSVGNISKIFETEGWQQRRNLWKEFLEDENDDMVADKYTVSALINDLNKKEALHLWIWMGQNEQDVCGYYWLIPQLRPFAGRVHVLYLNNLPFINEKGSIFYPSHLAEILPAEFIKARRLHREISAAEFELDEDEWKKLCAEDAFVRTLEGGKKIISQPGNYFDQSILKILRNESCKLPKLLSGLSLKLKIQKPDKFWMWRIKHLAMNDTVLVSGEWEKPKDIMLKVNSGELFQQLQENAPEENHS